MARSSTALPIRSCRRTWTNFTPISASEQQREKTKRRKREKGYRIVAARYRSVTRVGEFRARAGQDRKNRRALRSIRPVRRSRRAGLDAGGPDGCRGIRAPRQAPEE